MKWLTRFLEMDTGPVGEDKWRDYGDSETEYESYARRNRVDPRAEYLEEIEIAAMDTSELPIDKLVQSFCYYKGLITIDGVAETARDRRFLREALKVAKEARRHALSIAPLRVPQTLGADSSGHAASNL